MLQMNIINDTAIIFTNRRNFCCWGPCIENPRFGCCNSCITERQVNFGTQGSGNGGYYNEQSNGVNENIKNQHGDHNNQNDNKREWMSDTNQLD